MCYELTWFHKLCFGTAVQSHANPSVKGVLHITDVIQRAVYCVHVHPQRNVSLICVSPSTAQYKHKNSSTSQKSRLSESDKIYTDMHKKNNTVKINTLDRKGFKHTDRSACSQ